jgi:hypothetical protein
MLKSIDVISTVLIAIATNVLKQKLSNATFVKRNVKMRHVFGFTKKEYAVMPKIAKIVIHLKEEIMFAIQMINGVKTAKNQSTKNIDVLLSLNRKTRN